MNAWWETVAICLLMTFGILGSLWLAKRSKRYWVTGYCFSILAALAFVLPRYLNELDFISPFSWLQMGRTRYAIAAIIIPMLLTPLVYQIRQRRLKILLGAFGLLLLYQHALIPFLGPALARAKLLSLKTTIDPEGICLQQTSYTCGPASAVTALRKLGLPSEEGEISVWARTSSAGTISGLLADCLQSHYGAQHLTAHFQHFNSIREMSQTLPVLAVVKYGFLTDHFVTVLKITDKDVIVGDPLSGQTRYSYQSFSEIWRYSGIVLQRPDAEKHGPQFHTTLNNARSPH